MFKKNNNKRKYNGFCHASTMFASVFCLIMSVAAMDEVQAAACAGSNDLGGTVFRDYDYDGVNDIASSPDVAFYDANNPITIYAYDNNNAVVMTRTVETDGTYNFDAIFDTNDDIRLEFSVPAYLHASYNGAGNGTLTQQHSAGTCSADLGVMNAADYCDSNPLVTTSCYIGGDQTGSDNTLVGANFDQSGSLQEISAANEIGATWGLAYGAESKTLFAAALLKRHAGFGKGKDNTANTQDDISAIYVIDYSNPTASGGGSVAAVLDLADYGVDVGTNPRVASSPANDLSSSPNYDYDVYENIGRIGIGDIDLAGDTLYVVNINEANPQLVLLDVSVPTAPTLISATSIPDPGCPTSNSYSTWGVKVKDGSAYLGTVCRDDLRAYVQRFDGSAFSIVDLDTTSADSHLNLTYDRGCNYFNEGNGSCLDPAEWNVWTDDFASLSKTSNNSVVHTQAIASDIEFTADGNLVLGLMDRTGHQIGAENYGPDTPDTTLYKSIIAGDVRHFCSSGGGFIPEGMTGCTTQSFTVKFDPNETDGLASRFFDTESVAGNYFGSEDGHAEPPVGGVAIHPNTNQMIISQMNPEDLSSTGVNYSSTAYNSGGFRWFDAADGSQAGTLTLYSGEKFRKANGLGDVELLCEAAPLEVGNYVWQDSDSDGIQDADEQPISGIKVDLYEDPDGIPGNGDDAFISSYTTINGAYHFNVEPGSNYFISIDPTDPVNDPLLTNLGVTTADYAGNANHPTSGVSTDAHDSDAVYNSDTGSVIIPVSTGAMGENDYTLDFGFSPLVDISLSKTVDNTAPKRGDTVVYTLTVTNSSANQATGVEVTDLLPSGVTYDSHSGAGTYDSGTGIWNVGSVAANGNRILMITVTVD